MLFESKTLLFAICLFPATFDASLYPPIHLHSISTTLYEMHQIWLLPFARTFSNAIKSLYFMRWFHNCLFHHLINKLVGHWAFPSLLSLIKSYNNCLGIMQRASSLELYCSTSTFWSTMCITQLNCLLSYYIHSTISFEQKKLMS